MGLIVTLFQVQIEHQTGPQLHTKEEDVKKGP